MAQLQGERVRVDDIGVEEVPGADTLRWLLTRSVHGMVHVASARFGSGGSVLVRGFVFSLALFGLMLVSVAGSASHGAGTTVSAYEVPDVGCVSLVSSSYNASGVLASSYGFQMYSNGSEFVWMEMCDLPENNLASDYNESFWSECEAGEFDMVVSLMNDEGFWAMQEQYTDARNPAACPPTLELVASGPSASHSVVFEGNAMLGLMPETYCMMSYSDGGDVSVDVSVDEISPLMFEVSCVLENGGDTDISLYGVVEDFWHIVVVRTNGCTFKPMDTILISSIKDVAPGEEVVFNPKTLDASEYPDGDYVVLAPMSSFNGFAEFTVDNNDEYVNVVPCCEGTRVVWTDEDQTVATIEILKCCDVEDRAEDVQVRWDWESDGVWDTDYSSAKSVSHAFDGSGEHVVTYELTDTDGGVTTGTLSVTVEGGDDLLVLGLAVILMVVAVVIVIVVVIRTRNSG